MKVRISLIVSLLIACLLLAGSWPAAARDGSSPTASPSPALAPAGVQTNTQDFQDVPVGSTFFSYVHNLYVDGVVGGYPCGSTNPPEPCVPPGNLPYFRPGNNVTRGQNAKFTDLGRRVLSGPHTGGGGPDYGLFSALNTDNSNPNNAGLFGQGATGVWGVSHSSGTADGYGGRFLNEGGSSGSQYGVAGIVNTGWGLEGISFGSTATQPSAGVVGLSTVSGGAGAVFTGSVGLVVAGYNAGVTAQSAADTGVAGVFTASGVLGSVGLLASGRAGAVLSGSGATVIISTDGIDVGGGGGSSDGVYVEQPTGDANFSVYGYAHIHGTNIAGDDYESEVVYDGDAPLALGSVVALDPANRMGGPLGVLPAGADNADAAIGVVSYRLMTVPVNGVDKPTIDAQATEVRPGDRAYITILGRVAMPLPAGARVGTRLAVGIDGGAVVAGTNDVSFGRVASSPDAKGRGYVLVNFK